MINSNNNTSQSYSLVYSNDYEKNIFLNDFDDYDKKIEKLNVEKEYYDTQIQKLQQYVKENPTYDNLISFNKKYNQLFNKRTNSYQILTTLKQCKIIEETFQKLYNNEYRSIDEFEKKLTRHVGKIKTFVQCKPYLEYKFGNRLNIDFSNYMTYDKVKNENLILDKRTSTPDYYHDYIEWCIKKDFDNGYYYKITER